MRRQLLTLCYLLLSVGLVFTQATLRVDTTQGSGEIDRSLFSFVNYQALIDRGETVALRAFSQLNPSGGYQRMEINPPTFWPSQQEGFKPDELFATQSFRSVGRELIDQVRAEGMEPVLLLAYNTPWLTADGDITSPPTDSELWAQMASEALSVANGRPGSSDYALNVKYVEVWNSPDSQTYWKGTPEQYFDLFTTVSRRIRRDHPGVRVGGPSVSNYRSEWVREFLAACGEYLDIFMYHSSGETTEEVISGIIETREMVQKVTGNANIEVMVTEADNQLIDGAEKFEYLIRRQVLLQGIRDVSTGFNHFAARAFPQGDGEVGLVYPDGTIVGPNYWPFWILRDLVGTEIPTQLTGASDVIDRGLVAIASLTDDRLTTMIHLPRSVSESPLPLTVDITVPASLSEGIVHVSRADPYNGAIVDAIPLSGESRFRRDIVVAPGEAWSITALKDAGDELVWTSLSFREPAVLVGQRLVADVRITNLTPQSLTGSVRILGVPQQWRASAIDNSDRFSSLSPGETAEAVIELTAPTTTPVEGSGAYAFVNVRPRGARPVRLSSIASRVDVRAPVSIDPNLFRVFTTAGHSAQINVSFANLFTEPVRGRAYLELPHGVSSAPPVTVDLPVDGTRDVEFSVVGTAAAEPGVHQAAVVFDYDGILFREQIDVVIEPFPIGRISTIVDLSELRNVDGFTLPDDFEAYDQEGFGGRFSLPAHLMPEAGELEFRGVRFRFPDVRANGPNLVEARGQSVPAPASRTTDRFSALHLLVTSVNSSKEEYVTITYDDGTSAAEPLNVTDWCVLPRFADTPVIRAPYRHATSGTLRDCRPQIFMVEIPLDRAKRIRSITLPDRPTLYVVGVTLTN